jgi:hypothetical protein
MRATRSVIRSRAKVAEVAECLESGAVDVGNAFRIEYQIVGLRRGAAYCLPHARFDVALVGEEQAVVEPVTTTPGTTRAEGCTATSAQRPSRSTRPSTAS